MTSEECWRRGKERRGMYPWTLKELLQQFKHPRIMTLGIHSDRWGERQRHAVGITPHGSIFYVIGAGPKSHEKQWEGPVPQNYIPRDSIKTATRDPKTGTWKHGQVLRGWRPLLDDLVKAGLLRGCEEMTWLIGRDSRKLAGEYRLVGG
jgi:hypothetical protein